ncbi:hypothetical protein GL213_14415 [Halogeometricum borinquense]|uniref:Uncharacterized protein n=1 Tax=Halogeometricum borinquense TaxID=60847 RepID=A0A6C0UM62_9EURY|nr:hypothetical protein G3I44_16380 [Halogeometricum borinquense]QIQ77809.1 hypothetical protein GL213_14415 [Halogeometricum borinquense]
MSEAVSVTESTPDSTALPTSSKNPPLSLDDEPEEVDESEDEPEWSRPVSCDDPDEPPIPTESATESAASETVSVMPPQNPPPPPESFDEDEEWDDPEDPDPLFELLG